MATKFDLSVEDRTDAAKQGDALPDGSFPIRNEHELKSAIELRGHDENHPQNVIIPHIKKQAMKLGLTHMLPPELQPPMGRSAKAAPAGK